MPTPPSRFARLVIIGALWFAALAAAAALDRPVGEWVEQHRPIHWSDRHWKAFKRAGDFRYLLPIVVLVGLLHPTRWRGALLMGVASALAGAVYSGKWILGRSRPSAKFEPFVFHPFINGPAGFFGTPNLSFPSGHACLAFAAATSLGFLLPNWRWMFYIIAAGVGVERVLEFAHYPSDVVAGSGAGVLVAHLARLIMARIWPLPTSASAAAPQSSLSSGS